MLVMLISQSMIQTLLLLYKPMSVTGSQKARFIAGFFVWCGTGKAEQSCVPAVPISAGS